MMRNIGRTLWQVMAGLAVIVVGAGPASALSVAYDQQATTKGLTIRSSVRLKDGRFRAESTTGGINTVVIRNHEGDVYQYLPDQRMAMRLSDLDPAHYPLGASEDYRTYVDQHQGHYIGSEIIHGYPCDIYEFNDAGQLMTAWVWTEHPFPVKVIQRGVGGGELMTVELSHIQLDAPIDDEAFQLPPDVKVVDMGNLPTGSSDGSGEDLTKQMMQMLNQEAE